jgi:hypothetical protein
VESPVVLLDLGLLSITSTPKVKSTSLASQERGSTQKGILSGDTQSGENNDNNDHQESNNSRANELDDRPQRNYEIDAANTEFYDEFHLSMSNIQLVLINKVCPLSHSLSRSLLSLTCNRKRKSSLWIRSILISLFSIV